MINDKSIKVKCYALFFCGYLGFLRKSDRRDTARYQAVLKSAPQNTNLKSFMFVSGNAHVISIMTGLRDRERD